MPQDIATIIFLFAAGVVLFIIGVVLRRRRLRNKDRDRLDPRGPKNRL